MTPASTPPRQRHQWRSGATAAARSAAARPAAGPARRPERILVVGAGVVGLGIAHRLSRAGLEVTVVDAATAGSGASWGNAAKIARGECMPVQSPAAMRQAARWMLDKDSPLAVRPGVDPAYARFLLRMARRCTPGAHRHALEATLHLVASANDGFDRWAQEGIDARMHERGTLLAVEKQETLDALRPTLHRMEDFGIDGEELSVDAVHALEPSLTARIRGGYHVPGDRQIEPAPLTASLAARCRTRGVHLREHTEVLELLGLGGRITGARTDTGEALSADAVVLAAGPWSRGLARGVGVELPLQPGRGVSLDISPGPELNCSLTLKDAAVTVTPLAGRTRIAGLMEFGDATTVPPERRLRAVLDGARRSITGLDAATGEEPAPWIGLRAMTPDGLPLIGPVGAGGPEGLLVATGHGMLGLTMAPITAELIAADLGVGPCPVPDAVRGALLPTRRI